MSFSERLEQGNFPIALEITPPKTPKAQILLRRATLMSQTTEIVDIVQRKDRQSSLEAAIFLRGENMDSIWHLTTGLQSRDQIDPILERAKKERMWQVLMLKGDYADTKDTCAVRNAIALALEKSSQFYIGVAFNQYASSKTKALESLSAKIDAGAKYIQTQPIFNFTKTAPLLLELKNKFPELKIAGMCTPLFSLDDAQNIEQRLNLKIDDEILKDLQASGQNALWDQFESLLLKIAESKLVDALVVMTLQMDPPEEVGMRIQKAITNTLPKIN